jgi:predicted signal transduction protein with EAL and GGDEF domain
VWSTSAVGNAKAQPDYHLNNTSQEAEGTETKEQLDVLRSFGSQLGQGFYFARPLTSSTAESALSSSLLAPVSAAEGVVKR